MYKDLFLGKKVVCFDLDGTIVDTNPLWAEAIATVLKDNDIYDYYSPHEVFTPGEELETMWSGFIKEHPGALKEDKTAKILSEATNTAFLKMLDEVDLDTKPGFSRVLSGIHNIIKPEFALVTNSTKEVGSKILEKINLTKTLKTKVFGDDVKRKKPHPEMYQKVLKELNIKPKDMLTFEDSMAGVTAAAKAKIDIVLVTEEPHPENYPGNILYVLFDYNFLADNMALTYKETWDLVIQDIADKAKKINENKN